jgi:outer membrane protein with beta-barrel domain
MLNSFAKLIGALLLVVSSSAAMAQDVRYSWFEIGFVQQDIGKAGSLTDNIIGQTIDVSAKDGNGIKFRGSVGTWHNWFAFLDFSSSDITVDALVSNSQGTFPAQDEFDYTAVSGGIGLRWPLTLKTDVYAAVSYDSADLDFGSFAGENFDVGDKDVGARIGIRSMFRDKFEIRARVRYTNVGDVDLNDPKLDAMDADVLFGVGIGYELIRGLSITGDYESGEFSSWNIGFRLDLDED